MANHTYSPLGNLTRLQSPDTGTTTYRYDAAGNRIRQTDARGVQVSYAYDALNRLTAVHYPNASLDVGFFYDEPAATTACTHAYASPLGRLTRIMDGTGSTTYCYDDLGRIRLKTQVVDGRTFRVGYSYTKGDRLAAVTYPSGLTLRFTYGASGRATALAYRPGGGTADVEKRTSRLLRGHSGTRLRHRHLQQSLCNVPESFYR